MDGWMVHGRLKDAWMDGYWMDSWMVLVRLIDGWMEGF
jgi:hypothetical protein